MKGSGRPLLAQRATSSSSKCKAAIPILTRRRVLLHGCGAPRGCDQSSYEIVAWFLRRPAVYVISWDMGESVGASRDLLALACQYMLINGQLWIRPAQFSYRSGQVEPEHQHAEHQLVYASEGLLSVDTESSRWVVPPHRAVWLPALTRHTVTAKADTNMSTLYVNAASPISTFDRVTVVSVTPLLRELILHMIRSTISDAEHERLETVLLDQLVADPAMPLELPVLIDPRLRAIAQIFDLNPEDRRTLPQLGSEVGASERTLQRLFHTETGQSFGRWRTRLRLQQGVIELGKGRTVTQAASRSGYRETSAFIGAFRSAFGTTPGRYYSQNG